MGLKKFILKNKLKTDYPFYLNLGLQNVFFLHYLSINVKKFSLKRLNTSGHPNDFFLISSVLHLI